MKSWIFSIFRYAGGLAPDRFDPVVCQQTYDDYLALWAASEDQGFDGVFFSEHHFILGNLSPSPHLLIAALAQRTTTLRLGVMGSVVPLHDARRLAEECGMLDYLTRGRLEIGIGPGAGAFEAQLAGLDPSTLRASYHSGAELLQQALDNVRTSFADEF